MNNDTSFYFWMGQAIVLIGATTVAYISLTNRISIIETKQAMRDKFFDGLEKRTMELLHFDDNHLGLDKLVEKYRLNHYDLPMTDWIVLKALCEKIFSDKTISTEERLLASLAIGLAEHKLQVLHDRKPLLK